ncbi:protein of unknown function [Pedobacter steynii]|uniref:X-Pro dipeptidyl-peptidase n=1 Tax=Pedobacter steynii TaxID=430522 RepID=A0A1G9V1C4_9SPHI|nr:DUF885 family protein [Pedobacter steynii]NQX40951.1 DUF885 family protein [Pedobacter steynii]SDM66024.1 protein of unknown function [Pedobacter steynii]
MNKPYQLLLMMCLLPSVIFSQEKGTPSLYEQTSEMGTTIITYQQDVKAIRDFYWPYVIDGTYPEIARVYYSPEQRNRLLSVQKEYLKRMEQLEFDAFSVYGKVDYLLLKKEIRSEISELEKAEVNEKTILQYIPFASGIYAVEKERRRGKAMDWPAVAAKLNAIAKEVGALNAISINKTTLNKAQLKNIKDAIYGLKTRLRGVYEFYKGYDPLFDWWLPKPYETLTQALNNYASLFSEKQSEAPAQKDSNYGIKGNPIGQADLTAQLKAEMIPYSPEELLKIAEKEFAFCDQELLKAAAEMGFGKDWKKAQEKVKQSFVAPGKQPELIVQLQDDALDFIKKQNLMNIPELAKETWGMVMMSAERQLVNPFFTGGREISISYPTAGMTDGDKLMSMRGNNPYFSRGTVQHELLPGHHLQYYMNSRYKNYRELFTTPFGIEGWTLYWELLLYDKGFAKSPEERIGMLFWRMHRCARIIFSLNYHLGKWTPGQCVDFLVDRVGHEPANAEGEVRRSFEGGYSPLYQVAYMIGGLQLMALKHELVDSGKMTYTDFHERVMKENLIPIEMVRATLTGQSLKRDFTTQWKFYDFNK